MDIHSLAVQCIQRRPHVEHHSRLLDVEGQGDDDHGYVGGCEGHIYGQQPHPGLDVVATRVGLHIPDHACANHEEAKGWDPGSELQD